MSDIYLSIAETPTVVTLTNPLISSNVAQSVTVTNVVSVNVVTMPAITVQAAAPAVTTVAGTVSISNFPSTQTVAGTVTANGFDFNNSSYNPIPLAPFDETIGGGKAVVAKIIDDSGSGINFSAGVPISGTVTANVPLIRDEVSNNSSVVYPISGLDVNAIRAVLYSGYDFTSDQGAPVDGTNPLYVQGTVTANVIGTKTFVDGNAVTVSGFLAVGGWDNVNSQYAPIPLSDSGTGVRISFDDTYGAPLQVINQPSIPLFATVTVGNSVTIGANPSGALTTRFGSVTTANTAQITSAVTNTSRKYLLAQNISAGTVTIGIGFSPTTTQGIQLTAGGGLTFDAFCPTGAVYWLGAVTGAAFTILEG